MNNPGQGLTPSQVAPRPLLAMTLSNSSIPLLKASGSTLSEIDELAHSYRAMLVLAGSGPPTRPAIEAGQARFSDRIRELQDQGLIPRQLPADGTAQLQAILPAYFADPNFSFLPGEAHQIENDETTNRLSWMALGDYDLSAEAGQLSMPVLILWGEEDPFGYPMAEATRDALTGSEVTYVLLELCGHFWHECEDDFLGKVADFLE